MIILPTKLETKKIVWQQDIVSTRYLPSKDTVMSLEVHSS